MRRGLSQFLDDAAVLAQLAVHLAQALFQLGHARQQRAHLGLGQARDARLIVVLRCGCCRRRRRRVFALARRFIRHRGLGCRRGLRGGCCGGVLASDTGETRGKCRFGVLFVLGRFVVDLHSLLLKFAGGQA
ncbi:hypothetical protein D3C87_1597430 [compost metagenome]